MHQSMKAFLAAAAIAFGLSSPYALAQGAQENAVPATTQAIQPNDTQLTHYVSTYKQVAQAAAEYQPRLEAAPDDAARQNIIQEADQRLVSVVKQSGMSLDEYNGISLAIQQDPNLRQKVESMLQ
ncbi:DUF4168 domain-containing protein [Alcaligenes endophyticus]|uniref:DUF4168 domain-containing protein n=1 Tax=Alcaligenes endophyticus TaxID=1929088 RepID=A0ABT8EM94_9BURK|nr:DUF4168 domain-containing protein [Alcaligenes endophyticus]MCX5591000.1 DUF4168 domain-containing protein [Alcaligenes endophyticus]MDN4122423.1 DUF4168 domain-containing protein [Alcaligenes endophyticus]